MHGLGAAAIFVDDPFDPNEKPLPDLRLYAISIARAIKIPIKDAHARLVAIFRDSELLAALKETTDAMGNIALVTNVERVPNEDGGATIQVSTTALVRSHEKSVEPAVVYGRVEMMKHRMDEHKKYGNETGILRMAIAQFEINRARHSSSLQLSRALDIDRVETPSATRSTLPKLIATGIVSAWDFVKAPE